MSPRRPVRFTAAAALAAALALGMSCAEASDEDLIRELVEEAAARAEERDVEALGALFAADYEDFEGRDAAGTVRLIADHLARRRGVVVHVLGVRVGAVGTDGRAEVESEVALSHGAAEMLRRLVRFGGEYYRFRIEAIRVASGEWRFAYAEWRAVGTVDLFPESLAVLRKLFPDL